MSTSSTNSLAPGTTGPDSQQQQRLRLLPELNRFFLTHADIQDAFPGICRRLQRAVPHLYAGLALYEPGLGHLRLHAQNSASGDTALPANFLLPLEGTPAGEAFRMRRPVLVDDLRAPQFASEASKELVRLGQRSGCWVPLQTANSVMGTLWISSGRPGAFRSDDALLLNEASGQISLALANQLALQQLHQLKHKLAEQIGDTELDFKKLSASASVGIVHWGTDGRLFDANDAFLRMIGRTRAEMEQGIRCSDVTPPEYTVLAEQAQIELLAQGTCKPFEKEYQLRDGTRVPVLVSASLLGNDHPPWAAIVVDLRERRRISPSTGTAPRSRHSSTHQCTEDLVANSPAMQKIVDDLLKVAPTETTVLLLGETGTGKEMIARAICRMSPRVQHPFIKMNCAAIPAGLLESELFGHEKGAFTGAHARKIGRLELAHQGTLFLDEIGDVPLELQPKLLRVLQEREFERLGGTQTIRVDARLIAATNRDLTEMVSTGQFRRDLFYRLNVFPIHVPALRDRKESIPSLAQHFVQRFAQRLNRPPLSISPELIAVLEQWHWPGNIRELENLIERGVILSNGPDLQIDMDEIQVAPQHSASGQTLYDVEREHIQRILRDTNGVVGGKHGAASRLGLKRTTLQYKMKKLEIPRRLLAGV